MKDRTAEGKANDSAVYRFMLWNPFSYCLKQIGYSKANYSLILIGASQTNKTGATKVGNLFYNRNEEETTASTKYNYDAIAEIPKILNTEFKQKNRLTANSSYSGFSFTNSVINNDFDFITYNKNRTAKTQHKEFIINTSKLADYVNYYVEEYVEFIYPLNFKARTVLLIK